LVLAALEAPEVFLLTLETEEEEEALFQVSED
jgi:hypothetical protein